MPLRKRRKPAESTEDLASSLEKQAKEGKRDASMRDKEERIIAEYKARVKGPLSAIRASCIECMGGQIREVTRCEDTDCSRHPFRMGTNTMDKRSIAAAKARGEL